MLADYDPDDIIQQPRHWDLLYHAANISIWVPRHQTCRNYPEVQYRYTATSSQHCELHQDTLSRTWPGLLKRPSETCRHFVTHAYQSHASGYTINMVGRSTPLWQEVSTLLWYSPCAISQYYGTKCFLFKYWRLKQWFDGVGKRMNPWRIC